MLKYSTQGVRMQYLLLSKSWNYKCL